MAYLRQRSHGPRAMAALARARAREEEHTCYLIYDDSVRSYFACSAPENGWGDNEHAVRRFLPDGSSDEIDDVPPRVYPEAPPEAELLSKQLMCELDL